MVGKTQGGDRMNLDAIPQLAPRRSRPTGYERSMAKMREMDRHNPLPEPLIRNVITEEFMVKALMYLIDNDADTSIESVRLLAREMMV